MRGARRRACEAAHRGWRSARSGDRRPGRVRAAAGGGVQWGRPAGPDRSPGRANDPGPPSSIAALSAGRSTQAVGQRRAPPAGRRDPRPRGLRPPEPQGRRATRRTQSAAHHGLHGRGADGADQPAPAGPGRSRCDRAGRTGRDPDSEGRGFRHCASGRRADPATH